MKVLCVATKPPWPPRDGGRLLLWETLKALAAGGARIDLVAPVDPDGEDPARARDALAPWCAFHAVPVRRPGRVSAAARALWTGAPVTVARHAAPAVRERVARVAAAGGHDLVHAEQLQAVASCAPAVAAGLPLVLRAQNVESALWQQGLRRLGPAGAWEAARLARWEGQAVAGAAAAVALTAPDADQLRRLAAGRGDVHVVPAPFPAELPPAPAALPGAPAVVVLGSPGWRPNDEGAAWFARDVWPAVRRRLPRAALHVFGLEAAGPGVQAHPPPADSAAAFPADAVLAVPLRIGSGVRMKILEAWARGVPVVATPEAARGLEARDGRELLLATGASGFAEALARLHEDAGCRRALVEAGRAALVARHAPAEAARALRAVYARACGRAGAAGRSGNGA